MKYLPLILAAFYFILPWDLIPDMLGLFGRLDDLVLAYLLYRHYKKLVEKAETQAGQKFNSAYQEKAAGPKKQEDNRTFDPYEILELSPGATKDDISRAYRLLAAKYHPDKVEHLGKELRELAHKKMIEIQEAYQQLSNN